MKHYFCELVYKIPGDVFDRIRIAKSRNWSQRIFKNDLWWSFVGRKA